MGLLHPDLPGSSDGELVIPDLLIEHVRQGDGSLGLKVKVSDPAPVLRRNLTVDLFALRVHFALSIHALCTKSAL